MIMQSHTHIYIYIYIYICKIYYYEAFTGPMWRVLLSLQSKFCESTILLKGYEILKELGWSWPAKQKTHKHNCDMISWQFRYERLVCWQGNHEEDSRIRTQRLLCNSVFSHCASVHMKQNYTIRVHWISYVTFIYVLEFISYSLQY
jgi:hypothetical protein